MDLSKSGGSKMRQISTHANCAKHIRKELRDAFPTIKFQVLSESYSMGSSVNVYWTDGPTQKQVDEIIKKYQYGHFNGMEDLYEYSNSREDIPQTKFVFAKREISEEFVLKTALVAKEHYSDLELIEAPKTFEDLSNSFMAFNQYYNWHQLVWPILSKIDLTGARDIEEDPDFEGGSLFDGFKAVRWGE